MLPRAIQLFKLARKGCHGHGVLDMAVRLGKRQLPSHGHPEDGVTVAPQIEILTCPVLLPRADLRTALVFHHHCHFLFATGRHACKDTLLIFEEQFLALMAGHWSARPALRGEFREPS